MKYIRLAGSRCLEVAASIDHSAGERLEEIAANAASDCAGDRMADHSEAMVPL